MRFEDVFEPSDSRERIVLTFLAILILTKTGVVRISQQDRFDDIIVEYVGADHD
jgi:chromatin segregation and condensation protein Rec8/ScpA/Scc1 (kleisin family)